MCFHVCTPGYSRSGGSVNGLWHAKAQVDGGNKRFLRLFNTRNIAKVVVRPQVVEELECYTGVILSHRVAAGGTSAPDAALPLKVRTRRTAVAPWRGSLLSPASQFSSCRGAWLKPPPAPAPTSGPYSSPRPVGVVVAGPAQPSHLPALPNIWSSAATAAACATGRACLP
jgi:hypothetical protein